MSSVPEVDFTVRALEIGDIVLIALDGIGLHDRIAGTRVVKRRA